MTNQKKPIQPPFWMIAIPGIVIYMCAGCFGLSVMGNIFGSTPPPQPTLDMNAISTSAFETVIAAGNIHTETLTPFPNFTATTESTATHTFTPAPTSLPTETNTPAPTPISAAVGASCIPQNPPQTGRVVQVVDGDTIKVLLDENGLTYTIRYVGVDTPENTSEVEYYGPESTAKNIELVGGKAVTLIKDVSETDPYGRMLRYVLVGDVFVNYELVSQGFANAASFPPDISCIPAFQAVEQKASASKLGLWSAPPTLVVVVPATSASGGGNAVCSCGGPDLDCKANFSSHAAAQACYNYCVEQGYGDVFKLDGSDGDGLACESLP